MISKNFICRYLIGILVVLLLFLMICIMEITIVASKNIKANDEVFKEVLIYEIYSLKDSKSIEGKFSLGCGRIGTKEYYCFYIKTKNGLKLKKIEANDVYIQETDEESPRLVYQYHENSYTTWNDFLNKIMKKTYTRNIILKVPTGTVTTEYNLDLE